MSESLQIAWSEDLSTGNPATDAQHKYLIDIINELAEAIESGKAAQKLKTILNLLKYYTEWHFEREEKCMHRLQCPSADANIDAHKQFMETFAAFANEYESSGGAEEIAMRMYKTLVAWLVDHIQKIDGHLRHCTPAEEQA